MQLVHPLHATKPRSKKNEVQATRSDSTTCSDTKRQITTRLAQAVRYRPLALAISFIPKPEYELVLEDTEEIQFLIN